MFDACPCLVECFRKEGGHILGVDFACCARATASAPRNTLPLSPYLVGTPAAIRFVSAEPLLAPIDFSPWLDGISWLIIGGESGPNARPLRVEWVVHIIDQCKRRGVSCFVKQLGSATRLKSAKGDDPSEWPQILRVREFPATVVEATELQPAQLALFDGWPAAEEISEAEALNGSRWSRK